MDIKNLSEREREALLSKLQAEKEKKGRGTERRTTRSCVPDSSPLWERKARKYIKDGQEFKEWLRKEATAYYDQLKEYGGLKRDESSSGSR